MRNNDTLAKTVLENIGAEGQVMRKYYQRRLPENPMKDYYFIHRETGSIQPILVEYGFIDNPADAAKLQNNLLDYVEAVVRALAIYTGTTYIPPEGENYYTVKAGDSLWSIASKYNTSVEELKSLNNLTSSTLQIGQLLKLPSTQTGVGGATTYTVSSGDSLWSIANKFNTTVAKLRELNNLTTDVLQIGQVLIVGEQSVTPPVNNNYITYTVKSGDSLWSIANKYNTTVNELISFNNLTSNVLSIGQQLQIPQEGNIETEEYDIYVVAKGDSLWSIAKRYGITVDELININNLTNLTLQIGDTLKVPRNSSLNTYVVKVGDSLWSIAKSYNTTVDNLKQLNGLTSNTLQIGQVLIVP